MKYYLEKRVTSDFGYKGFDDPEVLWVETELPVETPVQVTLRSAEGTAAVYTVTLHADGTMTYTDSDGDTEFREPQNLTNGWCL